MQSLFACLLVLQFVVVLAHDWLDIPGWTHGRQVRAVIGRRKLLIATVVNGMFPGAAVAFALFFWRQPKPGFVTTYWILYCSVTVASAILMWWIPYFLGTSEENRRNYERMYEGTRHLLPARGNHPRPNLLHLCFHALFAFNLGVAFILAL